MPDTPGRKAPESEILSCLSQQDQDLLLPLLRPVDLPLRKQLESRNRRIEFVYFISRGMASVVANGAGRGGIEIGVIGREGVTGVAVIMATDRSPYDTYMQLAGAGHRISAASLRSAMAESRSLQQLLLRCAYAFTIQTAQTALANGRFKIEERLARWLLMAHDRSDGNELHLTHEFLALMLGVRRPGVTVALSVLEKAGLIKAKRGGVLIIDRIGLEECSNGAYGTAEVELRRLMN
jgi:CRP-like cAMP-binding protein